VLEVSDIDVAYGQKPVLNAVSVEVQRGQIVAVFGPNGAGKSTLLKAIVGFLKPSSGKLRFLEADITALGTADRVRAGMAAVLQGGRVFTDLSVWENLDLGAYLVRDRHMTRRRLAELFEIFPILRQRLDQSARTLSGGERQMLAVARALMPSPQLLLLDEPSVGLSPAAVSQLMEALRRLRDEQGVSMLVVEQNVRAALSIADRVYALRLGSVALVEAPPFEEAFAQRLEQVFVS
jgi:branched-chain amino acid transport system ATP-binding protein